MDFLEGFLVGPVWSDTEYRSRRHLGAHIVLAAFMAAVFVLLLFKPELQGRILLLRWPRPLVLLLVLLFISPLISIFYRRLPYYVRPLLLPLYAVKYILLFFVLVHYFLPLLTFETESILTLLYARMDDHIGMALETIAGSGGILATVAGVLAGGLWVIGEGLAFAAILILVPLLAIALCKSLQYGIDWAARLLLDRAVESMGLYPLEEAPAKKKKQGERPGTRFKAGIRKLTGRTGTKENGE
ncbi:MAG TPA: hypothetical protein GX720_03585 [Clostridiaceae bacterium]|nr:hypothetical protein [Clostridiaceae bacterium]